MLKSIFSYKSIELLGGMTYILSGVRVLSDFGPLFYGDEYSTVEVNFEKGILIAYDKGELKHEFYITLTVPKTTTVDRKIPALVSHRKLSYRTKL